VTGKWLGAEAFKYDGACRGSDPSLFMERDQTARDGQGEELEDVRAREVLAKQVCDGCKVQMECLEWALQHKERGVWGKTTRRERVALMRVRRGWVA
jgi:WhiB family redox-sensing transcriptional regulator